MSGLSRIRDNVSSSMVTCLPVDCCFSFNWVLVIVPRAQHRKGGQVPRWGIVGIWYLLLLHIQYVATIYIYKIVHLALNNNHSLHDSMGIVTYKITLVHLLNLQQLFEFWHYSNKTKRHEKQWLMLYFFFI